MGVGDMFVVRKGVRHRPVAKEATREGEELPGVLMVEMVGTVNTGDEEEGEGSGRTVYVDEGET